MKFNEVTWYSKILSGATLLLALPLGMFYLGAEVERLKFGHSVSISVVDSETRSGGEPLVATETYTDPTYGWAIDYPFGWAIETGPVGLVKISAPATATDLYKLQPPVTLTIETVRKDEFDPVTTKYGKIVFDTTLSALVDISGDNLRCLPKTNEFGAHGIVPAFTFDSTLMDSPAREFRAIISSSTYLVLMREHRYSYLDGGSETGRQLQSIYGSFRLADPVSAVLPECARPA